MYSYFRRFQDDRTWEAVDRFLLRRTRRQAGRDPVPRAGIIDAQTVRCAPQAGLRGVDAGKTTNGRKRHVVVDTLGLLLMVFVTAGNVQDRGCAPILLGLLAKRFPRLCHVWADGGYSGEVVTWAHTFLRWVIEIVPGLSG